MSAALAATRDAYPALLAATEPEVRTRIRIEHSRTIKEGWGYETTVEIEFTDGDNQAAYGLMGSLLSLARELGETERNARQRRDELAKAVAP